MVEEKEEGTTEVVLILAKSELSEYRVRHAESSETN